MESESISNAESSESNVTAAKDAEEVPPQLESETEEDAKDLQLSVQHDAEFKLRLSEIQTWWEIPAIAHFCSLFKAVFGFCDFDIEDLEEALITSPSKGGSTLVLDIICQLLNGCYARDDIKYYNYDLFLKDVFKQRWQKELGRASPVVDSTFLELPVRDRVEVLHALCDFRLDADDVAEMLKGLSGDSLRVDPLGVDGNGAKYWYFYGTRLYREMPTDDTGIQKGKGKKSKKKQNDSKEVKEEDEGEAGSADEAVEGDSKLRRNPSLSAKPRLMDQEEGGEEGQEVDDGVEMLGDNTDTKEESIQEAEEEEEEEEEHDYEDQIFESDDDASADNDEDDEDFEEQLKKKRKKSPGSKKKSSAKKASADVVQDEHQITDETSTGKLTIESVVAEKVKTHSRRGRSKGRGRGQAKGGSRGGGSQSRSVSQTDARESTERKRGSESRRGRGSKSSSESTSTPRRTSRRHKVAENEEDVEDVLLHASVSRTELKRLAIDGFQKQFKRGGRKADTDNASQDRGDERTAVKDPSHMTSENTDINGQTEGEKDALVSAANLQGNEKQDSPFVKPEANEHPQTSTSSVFDETDSAMPCEKTLSVLPEQNTGTEISLDGDNREVTSLFDESVSTVALSTDSVDSVNNKKFHSQTKNTNIPTHVADKTSSKTCEESHDAIEENGDMMRNEAEAVSLKKQEIPSQLVPGSDDSMKVKVNGGSHEDVIAGKRGSSRRKSIPQRRQKRDSAALPRDDGNSDKTREESAIASTQVSSQETDQPMKVEDIATNAEDKPQISEGSGAVILSDSEPNSAEKKDNFDITEVDNESSATVASAETPQFVSAPEGGTTSQPDVSDIKVDKGEAKENSSVPCSEKTLAEGGQEMDEIKGGATSQPDLSDIAVDKVEIKESSSVPCSEKTLAGGQEMDGDEGETTSQPDVSDIEVDKVETKESSIVSCSEKTLAGGQEVDKDEGGATSQPDVSDIEVDKVETNESSSIPCSEKTLAEGQEMDGDEGGTTSQPDVSDVEVDKIETKESSSIPCEKTLAEGGQEMDGDEGGTMSQPDVSDMKADKVETKESSSVPCSEKTLAEGGQEIDKGEGGATSQPDVSDVEVDKIETKESSSVPCSEKTLAEGGQEIDKGEGGATSQPDVSDVEVDKIETKESSSVPCSEKTLAEERQKMDEDEEDRKIIDLEDVDMEEAEQEEEDKMGSSVVDLSDGEWRIPPDLTPCNNQQKRTERFEESDINDADRKVVNADMVAPNITDVEEESLQNLNENGAEKERSSPEGEGYLPSQNEAENNVSIKKEAKNNVLVQNEAEKIVPSTPETEKSLSKCSNRSKLSSEVPMPEKSSPSENETLADANPPHTKKSSQEDSEKSPLNKGPPKLIHFTELAIPKVVFHKGDSEQNVAQEVSQVKSEESAMDLTMHHMREAQKLHLEQVNLTPTHQWMSSELPTCLPESEALDLVTHKSGEAEVDVRERSEEKRSGVDVTSRDSNDVPISCQDEVDGVVPGDKKESDSKEAIVHSSSQESTSSSEEKNSSRVEPATTAEVKSGIDTVHLFKDNVPNRIELGVSVTASEKMMSANRIGDNVHVGHGERSRLSNPQTISWMSENYSQYSDIAQDLSLKSARHRNEVSELEAASSKGKNKSSGGEMDAVKNLEDKNEDIYMSNDAVNRDIVSQANAAVDSSNGCNKSEEKQETSPDDCAENKRTVVNEVVADSKCCAITDAEQDMDVDASCERPEEASKISESANRDEKVKALGEEDNQSEKQEVAFSMTGLDGKSSMSDILVKDIKELLLQVVDQVATSTASAKLSGGREPADDTAIKLDAKEVVRLEAGQSDLDVGEKCKGEETRAVSKMDTNVEDLCSISSQQAGSRGTAEGQISDQSIKQEDHEAMALTRETGSVSEREEDMGQDGKSITKNILKEMVKNVFACVDGGSSVSESSSEPLLTKQMKEEEKSKEVIPLVDESGSKSRESPVKLMSTSVEEMEVDFQHKEADSPTLLLSAIDGGNTSQSAMTLSMEEGSQVEKEKDITAVSNLSRKVEKEGQAAQMSGPTLPQATSHIIVPAPLEQPPSLAEPSEVSPSQTEAPIVQSEAPTSPIKMPNTHHMQTLHESLSSQTEVPTSQTELPTSQNEVPTLQNEAPSSPTEMQTSQIEALSLQAEVPISQTKAPTSQNEAPSSPTEMQTSQNETPASETEVLTLHTETPVSEREAPTLQTETKSSETEVPTLHTETTGSEIEVPTLHTESAASETEVPTLHKETTASETEVPTLHIETTASDAEVPTLHAEITASETEVPTLHTETTASDIEVPTLQTETTASVTEVPTLHPETANLETEMPTSHTETPASETEVLTLQTETPASETEVPSLQTETTASEAEVSISHANLSISVDETLTSQTGVPTSHTETPAPEAELLTLHTETPASQTETSALEIEEPTPPSLSTTTTTMQGVASSSRAAERQEEEMEVEDNRIHDTTENRIGMSSKAQKRSSDMEKSPRTTNSEENGIRQSLVEQVELDIVSHSNEDLAKQLHVANEADVIGSGRDHEIADVKHLEDVPCKTMEEGSKKEHSHLEGKVSMSTFSQLHECDTESSGALQELPLKEGAPTKSLEVGASTNSVEEDVPTKNLDESEALLDRNDSVAVNNSNVMVPMPDDIMKSQEPVSQASNVKTQSIVEEVDKVAVTDREGVTSVKAEGEPGRSAVKESSEDVRLPSAQSGCENSSEAVVIASAVGKDLPKGADSIHEQSPSMTMDVSEETAPSQGENAVVVATSQDNSQSSEPISKVPCEPQQADFAVSNDVTVTGQEGEISVKTEDAEPVKSQVENAKENESDTSTKAAIGEAPCPEETGSTEAQRPVKSDEIKEERLGSDDEDALLAKPTSTPKKELSAGEIFLYRNDKKWFGSLSKWQLVCDTEDDWSTLIGELKTAGGQKTKQLVKIIREDFLPEIPSIMADKETARQKRAQEMMPRRSSYRLELKKLEEEEKERQQREVEEEEERQRAAFDEERRQQMKIEEERRQREEREKARQDRAKRARMREERAQLIAEGKEIPPELMNGLRQDEADQEDVDEDLKCNLRRVLVNLKDNEYSWPFWEPVEEANTYDYFDVVKEPMDLLQIEKKLEEKGYKEVEDFEHDVNLVFDNCLTYHGKDSDFGYMAENLKGIFERCMRRTFRVYVDAPARPLRSRHGLNSGPSSYEFEYGYAGSRSARRPHYKEDSDSDLEREERIIYPSGRKWGEDNAVAGAEEKQEDEKSEEKTDDSKPDETEMRPRATWSYRRELAGGASTDFESYIPCSKKAEENPQNQPPRKAIDLSKFAGAKFRYADSIKSPKTRHLPTIFINEYVKSKSPKVPPQTPPTPASTSSSPAAPAAAPGKPPVKVVKISREEYEKLLAQKKITVIDGSNTAGKVIKLQPGLQLKQTTQPASSPAISAQPNLSPADSSPSTSVPSTVVPSGDGSDDPKPLPAAKPEVPADRKLSTRAKRVSSPELPPMDIKTRLREIKGQMASKLKSSRPQKTAMYENSKIVNGEMVFNVAPDKMNKEVKSVFGVISKKRSHGAVNSRYLDPSTHTFVESVDKRQRGEAEEIKEDDDEAADIPSERPRKRVRFSDECGDDLELECGAQELDELNQRMWSEPAGPSTQAHSADKNVPAACSASSSSSKSSHFSSSSSLDPSSPSVYDKWKKKTKRIFHMLETDKDRRSPSKKLRLEQSCFAAPSSEVTPISKELPEESSRPSTATHEEGLHQELSSSSATTQEEGLHQEPSSSDSQKCPEETSPSVSEQLPGTSQESSLEGEAPALTHHSDSESNFQVEESQVGGLVSSNGGDDSVHPTEESTEHRIEETPKDEANSDKKESVVDSLHDVIHTTSEIPQALSVSPPTETTHSSNRAHSSSPSSPSSKPSPSTETSSSSSPSMSSAASSKRTFRLSGLTSQLAFAMAQKKKGGVEDSSAGSGNSPRPLSPPLLEPMQQEDVVAERVWPQEGEDEEDDAEMPILVPDQLPPTFAEPGSDNIFERMMNPENAT